MRGFSFVIVSGPPGSGKSTLAVSLSARLGLPVFSKDTIKEALMDALGVPDVDASRRLGAAAVRTLLAFGARERMRRLGEQLAGERRAR